MKALILKIPKVNEAIRFGLVGISSNLLSYSIFLFFTWLGLPPKLVMTILYFNSTIINFFSMKLWVFKTKNEGDTFRSIIRFLLAYFVGYLINLALLLEFSDRLGYSYQLVQAGAIVLIALYFFVTLKFFVFPDFHEDKDISDTHRHS